jgi:hypothetical protein
LGPLWPSSVGEVAWVKGETLALRLLRSTICSDLTVEMADPKAAYDLEKGQRVKVRFTEIVR